MILSNVFSVGWMFIKKAGTFLHSITIANCLQQIDKHSAEVYILSDYTGH